MSNKDHWQEIYKAKTASEVSWYQKEPRLSLELIRGLLLASNEKIIDVGGGASTLVDCLLDEGFKNITVLDLSSAALAQVKHRLGEKSELINWLAMDVTEYTPNHKYSLWHDRAVFHFLTEKTDREKYIKVLEASVRDGGHVVIAAFSIGGPTKCSGLDIVQYDTQKLKTELGSRFKLVDERSDMHLTPAGKEQLFGYYLFTKTST